MRITFGIILVLLFACKNAEKDLSEISLNYTSSILNDEANQLYNLIYMRYQENPVKVKRYKALADSVIHYLNTRIASIDSSKNSGLSKYSKNSVQHIYDHMPMLSEDLDKFREADQSLGLKDIFDQFNISAAMAKSYHYFYLRNLLKAIYMNVNYPECGFSTLKANPKVYHTRDSIAIFLEMNAALSSYNYFIQFDHNQKLNDSVTFRPNISIGPVTLPSSSINEEELKGNLQIINTEGNKVIVPFGKN